ncbi:MAG: hypothetical protein ACRDJE_05640 [Dehalococcoidia bacterium]
MTLNTSTQQPETAGRSAAAKLQAYLDGLTPDEQQAIERGLRRLVTQADERAEDAAGYAAGAFPTGALVTLAAHLELYRKWAEAYESWR